MVMWAATGRRYGLCTVTVQPRCDPGDDRSYRTYPVSRSPFGGGSSGDGSALAYPVIEDGLWYNRGGGCGSGCGCEVWLDGPTTKARITSVTVAGQVVSPAAYQVHDGHKLARIDGTCWPACNSATTQDPPAFTVTYTRGTPIPPAVQAAFEVLACEYATACAGGTCRLPQRLSRLSRQGVELEVEQVPMLELGARLRTGIKEVDDVIAAVNPHGLTTRPVVMSPDLPPARMLT